MRFKKKNVQQDIISLIRSRFYSITFSLLCKKLLHSQQGSLAGIRAGRVSPVLSSPCQSPSEALRMGLEEHLFLCSSAHFSLASRFLALMLCTGLRQPMLHSWCFIFPLSLLASWPCGEMRDDSDGGDGLTVRLDVLRNPFQPYDSMIALYDQCENAPWNLRKVSWWLSCCPLVPVVRGV